MDNKLKNEPSIAQQNLGLKRSGALPGKLSISQQGGLYVLFTFLISWGCWWSLSGLTAYNMIDTGALLYWVLYAIGGNGPCIAAFIVKKAFSEKEEFRRFIQQIIQFKCSPLWYAGIVLVLTVQTLLPWVINFMSGKAPEPFLRQPLWTIFLLMPAAIFGGGLEEVGWRGVLLPGLRTGLPRFVSAAVIGVIWSLWHLPLWFIKGTTQEHANYFFYIVSIMCLSLFLTILYDQTRSIFMCVLFHCFSNSLNGMISTPTINPYLKSFSKLVFCLAVFVLFEAVLYIKQKGKRPQPF